MPTTNSDNLESNLSPEMAAYRDHLVQATQKSQESFDKTVISLSGGALAISFLFLKDVIGPNAVNAPWLLLASWCCWGTSAMAILISHQTSHYAINKAIRDVDSSTIDPDNPGGYFSKITVVLNIIGASFFVFGVFFITVFAYANLVNSGVKNG
tara:strand:- start:14 stop:475 length:462 start_codon:yes stop_codon:yes gene_type:complete